MRRFWIVGGGFYLSISAAWGSGQLLMPLIGEWAGLVAVITFTATILIVDQAFPLKTALPGQVSY